MTRLDTTLRTIINYQLRRTTVQTMAVVNTILAQYNLRRTTFGALSVVVDQPAIKQGTLADVLSIDRPNIVKIIDRLEEADLVMRKKVESDRRIYALMPTEKGIALVDKVLVELRQLDSDILKGLSDTEITQFHQVLQTIEENAKKRT